MDIFSYMDNIWFREVNGFVKSVDRCRNEMLSADESLLHLEEYTIDIDCITELHNGRLYARYKGYQFRSFFYRKDSKFLFVILNGALTGRKPQFNRWSYYSFLDGSVLDIADPMYERYDNLELGWYYGTDEENLRIYLTEYVKKISDFLHVEHADIIFLGSSGGGAAALECVNYFQGAIAISINPQVQLCDYSYAHKFEDITRVSLTTDNWYRADGIYQLKQGKHILLINLRSEYDMDQLRKICDELGIAVKYGINKFSNLIVWIYDCDLGHYKSAHTLQENYCVCFCIEWLAHNFDNEQELRNADSLFRLINEFWSYRYRLELEWRNQKLDFMQIKECIKNPKKIIVWGGGKIARQILLDVFDSEKSNYLNIEFIIDSNETRNGEFFCGIKIITPALIKSWDDFFIIVALENGKKDVVSFLENKGFQYKKDYIFYIDFYSSTKFL